MNITIINLSFNHKGVLDFTFQALNVVLRVAWVETIVHLKVGPVQTRLLDFLLASLEVIRRGHWNFYRSFLKHFRGA